MYYTQHHKIIVNLEMSYFPYHNYFLPNNYPPNQIPEDIPHNFPHYFIPPPSLDYYNPQEPNYFLCPFPQPPFQLEQKNTVKLENSSMNEEGETRVRKTSKQLQKKEKFQKPQLEEKKKIDRPEKKVDSKKNKQKPDEDYTLFEQKVLQKKAQKAGRNNNSNIFRAFVKILLSKAYNQKLEIFFQKIKKKHSLSFNFTQFCMQLKEKMPNFTNYINNKEFKRLYIGTKEFNLCLRILFRNFIQGQGSNHILTVSYKERIRKESVVQFLGGLHDVQSILQS